MSTEFYDLDVGFSIFVVLYRRRDGPDELSDRVCAAERDRSKVRTSVLMFECSDDHSQICHVSIEQLTAPIEYIILLRERDGEDIITTARFVRATHTHNHTQLAPRVCVCLREL